MKRILLITSIMLASVWTIGVQKMNISQNGYIPHTTENEVLSINEIKAATSSPIATSTKKIVEKTATTTIKKKIETQIIQTPKITIPPAPEPIPDFEMINTFARKAIVNIFCTVKGGEFSPISGTGVIIHSNGIILTNAHVGQYFLLKNLYIKDYIQCIARTGSPAYPKYNLELVYISPAWVSENKTLLKSQNPQGNGENDFAFLRITGMIDGTNVPAKEGVVNFPYIEANTRETISINEPVILVSYPAGFLGGLSILKDLNITSGITAVRDYFTFRSDSIDVISVPGTVVSQKGSSGGAVVDKNSSVIGIISTSSDGNTTAERNLNAITLGYISRSLKNEINLSLSEFLSKDLSAFAKSFQENEAVGLTKIITDELTKTN